MKSMNNKKDDLDVKELSMEDMHEKYKAVFVDMQKKIEEGAKPGMMEAVNSLEDALGISLPVFIQQISDTFDKQESIMEQMRVGILGLDKQNKDLNIKLNYIINLIKENRNVQKTKEKKTNG